MDKTNPQPAAEPTKSPIRKEQILAFFKRCGFPDMILVRLFAMYFLVSAFNVIQSVHEKLDVLVGWKVYAQKASLSKVMVGVIAGFAVLTVIHYFLPKRRRMVDILALFTGVLLFSLSLVWNFNSAYLAIALSLVAIVFISYAMGKFNQKNLEKLSVRGAALIVLALSVLVLAYVCVTAVAKHKVFSTACYDFGIFAQMFHSMKENFTAVTTCERDMPLSHFYVHTSFIYYALLPIYALFPSEVTLLVVQAFLAMGCVIPLFLIAKNHQYKGFSLVAVCAIAIFYAGILGPCYYDFHENAFLPMLLMWLLYAVDQKKIVLLYVMSVLVCIVKEDAPLYVLCIALYFLFEERSKKRWHGLGAAVLSGTYLILINRWLTEHGDGDMMMANRLHILMTQDDTGLVDVIKNIICNPGYFFSLFMHEQTILFFVQTMLPLLFLPFMTRKLHRFLLIIPYTFMNLVIGYGYVYAASVNYQYIFGPSALLIYMMLLNVRELPRQHRNTMTVAAAVVSMIIGVATIAPHYDYYEKYRDNKPVYQRMEEMLDSIPQDASVNCYTWAVAHIADREEIYKFDVQDLEKDENGNVIGVKSMLDYDFYVLQAGSEAGDAAIPYLEAAGYTIFESYHGRFVIYMSPYYQTAK